MKRQQKLKVMKDIDPLVSNVGVELVTPASPVYVMFSSNDSVYVNAKMSIQIVVSELHWHQKGLNYDGNIFIPSSVNTATVPSPRPAAVYLPSADNASEFTIGGLSMGPEPATHPCKVILRTGNQMLASMWQGLFLGVLTCARGNSRLMVLGSTTSQCNYPMTKSMRAGDTATRQSRRLYAGIPEPSSSPVSTKVLALPVEMSQNARVQSKPPVTHCSDVETLTIRQSTHVIPVIYTGYVIMDLCDPSFDYRTWRVTNSLDLAAPMVTYFLEMLRPE